MKNNFIVYMHTNKLNDKKYIGITGQYPPNKRWMNGKGYCNQVLGRAINKYGWDNFEHKILCKGLTKEEAEQKEIELIKKYKTNDGKYGYNVSTGGKGASGVKLTAEQRKHMSEMRIGRKLTKEWIANRTKSQTGLKRTQLTVNRIREANSKKVICINDRNVYSSMTEASNVTGVNIAHISNCCCGNRKSAGKDIDGKGLYWMFYNEYITSNYERFSNDLIIPKKEKCGVKPKQVICLNNKKVYNSALDASSELKIGSTSISKCCNKIQKSAGRDKVSTEKLYWMFYDEYIQNNKELDEAV